MNDTMSDGFCTCDGDSLSGRMRDCGIRAHRAEAWRERAPVSEDDWDSIACVICGALGVTLITGGDGYCEGHGPDDELLAEGAA